jgi:NAD(P)-dependent dehydrogenase (short-subunit alcohol dehydrogenase family)
MGSETATAPLRAGLLDGCAALVAGAPGLGPCGREALAVLSALGASAVALDLELLGEPEEQEQTIAAAALDAAAAAGEPRLLIVDGDSLLGSATAAREEVRAGGAVPLSAALQAAWSAVRAVAERSYIAPGGGGRVVLIAPRPGTGEHARAAAAGLENLARTLSIEWARYAITAVALVPGEATTVNELAVICAYLGSPAGEYFSGCALELR